MSLILMDFHLFMNKKSLFGYILNDIHTGTPLILLNPSSPRSSHESPIW